MATLQIDEETEIPASRTGIRVCGSVVASQLLADELMPRADGFFWTTGHIDHQSLRRTLKVCWQSQIPCNASFAIDFRFFKCFSAQFTVYSFQFLILQFLVNFSMKNKLL